MEWGNCLYYIRKKLEENGGGYVLLRKSRHAPIVHFLYIEELPEGLEVKHFVPDDPKKGLKALIDMFWFKGHEKVGE